MKYQTQKEKLGALTEFLISAFLCVTCLIVVLIEHKII